ncbi:hypothetical protein ACVNP1_08815 [Staphylococcus aureus]
MAINSFYNLSLAKLRYNSNDKLGGEAYGVIYHFGNNCDYIDTVGVLFYLRSNKRQIIEKAIERKNEIETLPFDQNLAQLSKLNLKGETKKRNTMQ